MKYLLYLATFVMSTGLWAQAPAVQWENTIGGDASDEAWAVIQTNDGGYFIGGTSFSSLSGDKTEDRFDFNRDYWVVKTDANGTIEWDNTIGGLSLDDLRDVQQTTDGGYILGGHSFSDISGDKSISSRGSSDYWIVKLDGSGAVQWQKAYGGSGLEYIRAIERTADGGYVAGGYSNSDVSVDKSENSLGGDDYWVVKLDATGTVQWENTVGGNAADRLQALQQTNDGGYVLAGWSSSSATGDKSDNPVGFSDYWVVKLDASGSVVWDKTIGGNFFDYLMDVKQTPDNGYILAGRSLSLATGDKTEAGFEGEDYWVVKLDNSGNIEWDNTIGGDGADVLFSIDLTDDGGYVLGGNSSAGISGDKTEAALGGYDNWIVKLAGDGTIQWQTTIGGDKNDYVHDIQQTSDGGYILGSLSQSGSSTYKSEASIGGFDYWLVKLQGSCAGFSATASSSGYLAGSGVTGSTLYLGYGPQSISLSVQASGGTAPYAYSWSPGGSLNDPSSANPQATPTSTTTYSVVVTDQNGCQATATETIEVVDATCQNNKVLVCHVNGNGNGNGNSGSNVLCINPNAVSAHLNHGDQLGPCQSNNSYKKGTANDMDQKPMKPAIHVFPNPSSGVFEIGIHPEIAGKAVVEISNVQGRTIGRVVKKLDRREQKIGMDFSSMAKGIYLIKVEVGEHVLTRKMIIQ